MSNITKDNAVQANRTSIIWDYGTPIRGVTPIKREHFDEIENTADDILTSFINHHKTEAFSHGIVTTQNPGFMHPDQVKLINSTLTNLRYLIIELPSKILPPNIIVGNESKVSTPPSGWERCDSTLNSLNLNKRQIIGSGVDGLHTDDYVYSADQGTTKVTTIAPVSYLRKKY